MSLGKPDMHAVDILRKWLTTPYTCVKRCMLAYVCMYVCMHACMYVCIYIYVPCIHVSIFCFGAYVF